MDAKRFVTGTVVGGVTMFAVGHVIWDIYSIITPEPVMQPG